MLTHRPGRRRPAATTVEFAVVALLLFVLLVGILEYGRFLFVYHLTTNAARDAARFAAVRTNGGITLTEPTGTTIAEPDAVTVFAVPDADLYATPPNLTATGKPVWTTADFHQQIAVQVTGTYKPVLTDLLGLGADVPVTVTVLMGSEAN